MASYEQQAAEAKPWGYFRVRHGRVMPDDLCWSVWTQEFLRFDDPTWQSKAEWVADTVYTIRQGTAPERKKTPEGFKLERQDPAPAGGQLNLF